ncbi:acyl-CoA-binding domain-containing protein 6 isoform X2 [Xenopus laevis]|uniref:Acyl-CoA-binding domain-containing protein 6 n=1 Tax=Xenopus laevis TaxID=8355 RepID=A0A8J1MZR3_XENLA|nr:acyl-CoA-binding domain-containing protein 6 isoform X2 [Xenopus laevis]
MASPGILEESSSGDVCSGGCPDQWEEKTEEELQCQFEQAAKHVQNVASVASTEQLLYLYARYKQVKVGRCNTPKPGFFDYEGKKKWEAWKALGDYSHQQAMTEYIETVKKLDPDWSPQSHSLQQRTFKLMLEFEAQIKDSNNGKIYSRQIQSCLEDKSVFKVKALEEPYKEPKTTFGGPVVSCLYKVQETLREEDKDIFDYCRENNHSRVSHALSTGSVDVNVADDEGRSLLHWACDRGHTQLVSVILFHNAHINMQDSEGQTPLHYASACEFPDIVDLLLDHGADPSLVDNDGFQPHEVTDSKTIAAMLQQHASNGEHNKPPSLLLEMPQ